MLSRILVAGLALATTVTLAKFADAANMIVVESKSVEAGTNGVTVGVYVTNDIPIKAIALPLEFREVSSGSFTKTSLALTAQGRVAASPLNSVSDTRYYSEPDLENLCSGPTSHSFSVEVPNPSSFFESPDAVTWVAASFSMAMEAGTDGVPGSGTPSFVFTFDVTDVSGTFEIDTCCTSNHIAYLDAGLDPVLVAFTKGIVTLTPPAGNLPPVALCRDVTKPAGADCLAYVEAADVDNGSYDPNGTTPTMWLVPPGPYGLGVTPVTLMVSDGEFTDACEAAITVLDQTPPVAICPGNIAESVSPGQTGAIVNFTVSATDNCPNVLVDANPPSGSFFPIGSNQVIVTATDGSGNQDICTFNVDVSVQYPPSAVVIESKQVEAGQPDASVGIYISNDIPLSAILLTLEFREITPGAFIESTPDIVVQGRVAASGLMHQAENFRPTPEPTNSCSGPLSSTYSIIGPPDLVSPDAMLSADVHMSNRLAPGTDGSPGMGTPSYLLSFAVTNTLGAFEIDTCCILPTNHLAFADELAQPITPFFVKGLIVIVSPERRNDSPTDANCDGVTDILDVVETVGVAFRNHPEKPPCILPEP